jgi:hypothetical protein
MRLTSLFFLCLFFTLHAKASLLLQGGLSYTSYSDASENGDGDMTRLYNKLFLGASLNKKKTLFFGWNINSWSSSLKQGTSEEDSYGVLEMGPRLQLFLNDNYSFYFSAEWNPYVKGDREKNGSNGDIEGSSYGIGAGYRFKITKALGLGVAFQYQTLNISKETINSSESTRSDSVSNIVPMLELSFMSK